MISWKLAQVRLAAAGYAPGPIDGIPGTATFTALFAFAAGRQPDATLRAIGAMAASPTMGLGCYGIPETPYRLAEFIAESSHECGNYTRFEENLRYSAARLMAVWPSRFKTLAAALPYAWDSSDPDAEDKALANLVYGGRMGNERNGLNDDDGWDHRGRGMFMFTGADNYRLYGARLGVDLIAHPDLAADPATSLRLACEFWKDKRANEAADRLDFVSIRQRINGGTIGIDDVKARRTKLLSILA